MLARFVATAAAFDRCKIFEPLTVIRSFRNADLPIMHRLWIEHWSAIGPPPSVREPQIEQAILARTFFEPHQLLIAESDGGPVAWLQVLANPEEADQFVIPACCLGFAAEPAVGLDLLREAASRISALGGERIQAGVVRDNRYGYVGLEPIGAGVGVSAYDARFQQALQAAGYQTTGGAMALEVSVPQFRPPVSREALQLRRSTRTNSHRCLYHEPREAAAMSHLDVETVHLSSVDGSDLASLNLWFSDPEAEVMSPTRMIVELGSAHQRGHLEPVEIYLLGAAIQMAAQRNILTAETVVDDERGELTSQLNSLQFTPTVTGAIWEYRLSRYLAARERENAAATGRSSSGIVFLENPTHGIGKML